MKIRRRKPLLKRAYQIRRTLFDNLPVIVETKDMLFGVGMLGRDLREVPQGQALANYLWKQRC